MGDKKHIDRLFQEKLKDFEVAPVDAVWDRIHDELHKDKRKRRLVPIWWKVAGVAAILALMFTIVDPLNWGAFNINPNNGIVDTKKNSSKDSSDDTIENNDLNSNQSTSSSQKNKIITSQSVVEESSAKNVETQTRDQITESQKKSYQSQTVHQYLNAGQESKSDVVTIDQIKTSDNSPAKNSSHNKASDVTANKAVAANSKPSKVADVVNGIPQNNAIIKTTQAEKSSTDLEALQNKEQLLEIDKLIQSSQTNSNTTIAKAANTETNLKETKPVVDEQTIEDAIAESTQIEEQEEEKFNRWNVSPNVAPVYFNSLGKGSSLDDQFVDNEKTGSVNMSYGINGSYAVSNRIKIRTGINRVDLGYSTSDVIVYQAAGRVSGGNALNTSGHISLNSENQNTNLLSAKNVNFANAPEILNTTEQVNINQQLGYIEVPMEMEYSLVNARFGLNVIGGFSTLFLNKNEIYSQTDGIDTQIGEANNINDLSYSANFGFGINYSFSEKIKLNVEPTFKYQINTFNDTSGDFQPFFIGVYTGFSYKF